MVEMHKEASLTNKKLQTQQGWKIQIIPDAAAKTLTIRDNGIGMNSDEVEAHIGTIANSGSRRFLEELQKTKKGANVEFIGQFGAG